MGLTPALFWALPKLPLTPLPQFGQHVQFLSDYTYIQPKKQLKILIIGILEDIDSFIGQK